MSDRKSSVGREVISALTSAPHALTVAGALALIYQFSDQISGFVSGWRTLNALAWDYVLNLAPISFEVSERTKLLATAYLLTLIITILGIRANIRKKSPPGIVASVLGGGFGGFILLLIPAA